MTTIYRSEPSTVPQDSIRRAVGYVRVSTSMQAEEGLSLEAQKAAITNYCAAHNLRLIHIYMDVESGGKADRPGLAEALRQKADVFVVLKFDRLSRSIKHFCTLYDDHFSKRIELVAIRESIKLDSALGRALVNVLLVFAQMEREAIGERTKETIRHIRGQGYFFGKVPYGKTAVPAPSNPRYRILVDNADEQVVLTRIKGMLDSGMGLTKIARQLNEEQVRAPQGPAWTTRLMYNLKCRQGWQIIKGHNVRTHTDQEAKARILTLRQSHTLKQVANILNEEGYKPLKGIRFTEVSVCRLIGRTKPSKAIGPKQFCADLLEEKPDLSFAKLAEELTKAGYLTPKGHATWWKAQARLLVSGGYDGYYRSSLNGEATCAS